MNSDPSLDSLLSSLNKATSNLQNPRLYNLEKKKSLKNESQKQRAFANSNKLNKKETTEILSSSKDHPNEVSESIFEGKKFIFIPYGMKLPAKRIEILSQNIAKKGGTVCLYSSFVWDPAINSEVSIIASDEINLEVIEKMIPAIFHNEIPYFTFIDCEWVTLCLQKNRWIHPAPYFLKLEDPSSTTTSQVKENPIHKIKKTEEPKINDAVKENKLEKQYDEGGNATRISAKSSITTMHSLQSNTSQKEADMDYKPYSYLFDYLYEPTKMNMIEEEEDEFSEEQRYSQTSILSSRKEASEIEEEYLSSPPNFEIDQQPEIITPNTKFESKKEEYLMKSEVFPKTEYRPVKKEFTSGAGFMKSEFQGNNNFTYILSDDDDEIIFEGNQKRKPKLEEDDVKGTFLEDITDLDKINTNQEGEVSELKDFKTYKPSKRNDETQKEKHQKEQILLCQPGSKTNLNAHLTNEFEKMLKVYEIQKDKGRVYAYGKMISLLKAFPKKIESPNDAKNVLGLGEGMIDKIQEILSTGKLQRAENMGNTEKMKILEMFDDIHGVGPATALQFYNKGFRTIDDLRKNTHLLTESQKIGVKYYEEFSKKIPREFVTEVFNFVASKIEELSDYKGQYEIICGGSYRRGRAYCGDIDIMMSPKDGSSSAGFCVKLIKSLEGTFLTDHLAIPGAHTHTGETYLGVCYFKGVHRRIDFKVVDRERFGPLCIFYTGGDYFNRSMRLLATKKGYHLENYGIYPALKAGKEKYALNIIPCYTEQDVFRILGLKYVPPEERDV